MFRPGEAYQFDWSHEDVEIAGLPVRVKVAHVRLCASRTIYVRAYPRETQEVVFDAHARAFAFFGGVPTRGIYDNMKTAVTTVFTGNGAGFQPPLPRHDGPLHGRADRLLAAAGWEKGQVVRRTVQVRAYADRIVVRCQGEVVADTGASSVATAPFMTPGTICRRWLRIPMMARSIRR
jgi:hypothetical protein